MYFFSAHIGLPWGNMRRLPSQRVGNMEVVKQNWSMDHAMF